ncbi:MAG TPA: hypothetical protein VMW10_00545 [Alphaproteobacteria bacterium]|nr:hypothetical protein [Alphaproteobacteria bacterium]
MKTTWSNIMRFICLLSGIWIAVLTFKCAASISLETALYVGGGFSFFLLLGALAPKQFKAVAGKITSKIGFGNGDDEQ